MKTRSQFKTLSSIAMMLLFTVFLTTNLIAQVAINEDSSLPDGSAMLDVKSTDKGFLVPRMTEAERNAIISPATGLLVYQTSGTSGFYYYDGTEWGLIGSGAISIDDLLDGKTAGNSVFLGDGAGVNDDGTDNENVAVGDSSLSSNTTGIRNTASGNKSLYSNTTGYHNTASGNKSLYYNTTGSDNTANGNKSLYSNTTGYYNTASGNKSLLANTTGWNNTASGDGSLELNLTGCSNTASGFLSLYSNTTGGNNTALGCEAGLNSTGSGSVYIGFNAGYNNTTGNRLYIENSASDTPLIYGEFDNDLLRINGTLDINNAYQFPISDGSNGQVLKSDGSGIVSWGNGGAAEINDLSDAKTGGHSVFLGDGAGVNDDGTDNKNVAVGYQSLNGNTAGYYNTASGCNSLYSNTTGYCNTVSGYECLYSNTAGNNSTASGYHSLYSNTTGNNSTASGYQSLYSNTTGGNNTASGCKSLYSNTTGDKNTASGNNSLYSNTTGWHNTALGYAAGYNSTGNENVYIGYKAGYNNTSGNRLYIENTDSDTPLIYGEFDNDILTINGKLGVGTSAPDVQLHVVGGSDASLAGGGYFVAGSITGQNVVMDENEIMARNNGAIAALHVQRDGGAFNLHYDNAESKQFVVASSGKTGIGENSPTSKLHINTASGEDGFRVQITGDTKLKVASNGSVVVGYNATSPTFALQLQNSNVDMKGRAIAYSWNTYSDGRLKTDQKALGYGLKEVMQLQPKSYFHHDSETKEDGTFIMVSSHKTHTFGFIAQELNEIIPEAVYVPKDETTDLWSIDYEKLIPVLTKAMQEQQELIVEAQKENTDLKKQVMGLLKRIEKLENNN